MAVAVVAEAGSGGGATVKILVLFAKLHKIYKYANFVTIYKSVQMLMRWGSLRIFVVCSLVVLSFFGIF